MVSHKNNDGMSEGTRKRYKENLGEIYKVRDLRE